LQKKRGKIVIEEEEEVKEEEIKQEEIKSRFTCQTPTNVAQGKIKT